jgi:hypothetical protein
MADTKYYWGRYRHNLGIVRIEQLETSSCNDPTERKPMIAMMDLSQVAPDFVHAITAVHRSCSMVAVVMCFGGFGWLVRQAQHERNTNRIFEGMSTLTIVVLLIANGPAIGTWIESVVIGVEQDAGINTSVFGSYLDVIKTRYAIDLTQLKATIPGEAQTTDTDTQVTTQQAADNQPGNLWDKTSKAVTDTFNAMLHPAEATESVILGVFMFLLSMVSVVIWWIMQLLQSILYFVELAVSPLFLATMLIPGWQNIAKVFIGNFVAICIWPIVFILIDLITQALLNVALSHANGLTSPFWMVGIALFVIFAYIFGPWVMSSMIVKGSTGTSELLGRAGGAAVNTVRTVTRL